MSGYIGTITPLKLKRDAPNTLSTIDRTVLPSHSALRKIPLFPPPAKQVLEMQPVQIAHKRSTPADTARMEREIADIISRDERLSERSRTHTKSGHSFSMRPLQSRVVLSKAHPIPSRVRQLYEQSANNEGRCDFAQGTLANSCLHYFAVGKKVLFYDMGRAVQTGSDLQDQFMHECQFDEAVLEVRELAMRHSVFGEFKNRSILLVVSPWKFSFASLDLQGGHRVESGPRWMRITLLRNSFATASQSVSHIVEDESEKRLYYLDEEGAVNSVSFENSNWMDKLMGACKYHLAQKTTPSSISMQAFFVSRKATILQRIRHYSKVVAAQVGSFYSRRIRNYQLVGDSKRKMLYSLVDTNYDPRECLPSTFKMLTAWDTSSNKIKIKCQMSEAELYEREIAGIANFPLTSNYRIARLFPVYLEQQANLIAVLHCGIRLYLSVSNSFKVVSYHFPPQIDRSHSHCDPREHHKLVQLTHCSISGSEVLLNLREEGENHSFFLWRMDESAEAQNCAEVNWGSNMSSPHGNPPQQDRLAILKLSLNSTKKEAILSELSATPTKNPFAGASSLHELHQLARDILLPPLPIVHSTDADIQWICQLRPVDQVFNAMHANLKEDQVLSRLFEDLPPEQIVFLLVQVLCDPEGLYLKDLTLIDCLSQFERRVMQQGGMPFHHFQQQFQDSATKARGRKPREIQPTYVSRDMVGKEMEERLLQMMVKLVHRNAQGKLRTQLQVQRLVCSGIELYLARLLRFLWRRTVKRINSKLQALVPMIEPLHRVLEHFKSPSSKPKLIPVRQYKLESFFAARKLEHQSEDTLPFQTQPLVEMQKLISKICQLITLCSKVDLKTDKTFSEALAMSSEQFEGPLFRFLTDKYEYPTVAIDLFRKNFPCFIGEQLEKSLRIWQESKDKNEAQIVAILKYHKTVPNYLMRYLEASGKIGAESARLLHALSTIPSSNRSLEQATKNQAKLQTLQALFSDFFIKK